MQKQCLINNRCNYRQIGKVEYLLILIGIMLLTSSVAGAEMVLLQQGCFQMGDTFSVGFSDERPVHEVCLSSFHIDKTEVTQKAYLDVIGTNPSFLKDPHLPVEQVTWNDAVSYCQTVGKRLPTEAEWEYAARSGGQNQKYAGTSSDADIGNYAWYKANALSKIHPVGEKSPNGLDISDMSGNAGEWVADWYDNTYYSSSPTNDPQGPSSGPGRTVRSGAYVYEAIGVRTAYRNYYYPAYGAYFIGFRCARNFTVGNPQIQVTPLGLSFNYVPVGSTKDMTLAVKNTGGGTLTGNATTTMPFFTIVSGGSYSLGADQSQVVTIRYQPTSKGSHTGTVVFTGGDSATVPVTGTPPGLSWLLLLLGN